MVNTNWMKQTARHEVFMTSAAPSDLPHGTCIGCEAGNLPCRHVPIDHVTFTASDARIVPRNKKSQ